MRRHRRQLFLCFFRRHWGWRVHAEVGRGTRSGAPSATVRFRRDDGGDRNAVRWSSSELVSVDYSRSIRPACVCPDGLGAARVVEQARHGVHESRRRFLERYAVPSHVRGSLSFVPRERDPAEAMHDHDARFATATWLALTCALRLLRPAAGRRYASLELALSRRVVSTRRDCSANAIASEPAPSFIPPDPQLSHLRALLDCSARW
jgi:hypothetical protein